jgi:hypothetical protein
LEYAPGATTRKRKDLPNIFLDKIKRIHFPKRTLEQRIIVRPKTKPKIVFPGIPGLLPWFVDEFVEESNSEANEDKEGK